MDKMERDEKLWGGILGIIAILAAIAEMFINGPDAASFMGAVKDVSGTLIVVILLVAFLKNLPRKPKNLTEILEKAVEDWGLDNAPLIFKIEGFNTGSDENPTYKQGFNLLQQPEKYIELVIQNLNRESSEWMTYAGQAGRKTGKFIAMPSYQDMTSKDTFDVLFIMEQKHFKESEKNVSENIKHLIIALQGRGIDAKRIGEKSYKFTIKFRKINTMHDVEFFVDTLDLVLSFVKIIV